MTHHRWAYFSVCAATSDWNSDFRVHTTSVLFALLQPPFYSRDTAEMYENILYKPLRLRTNVSPAGRNILEEVRLGLLLCGVEIFSIKSFSWPVCVVTSCRSHLFRVKWLYASSSSTTVVEVERRITVIILSVLCVTCVLSFNPSH